MSALHLSAYGLRPALIAGIQRVIDRRDAINRINVFPVADGDTGTNLACTLGVVLQGLREPCFATAEHVLRRAATDAHDGARGNSGAILAQFLQGAADALAPGLRLAPAALAQAALRGSALARTAMAVPREGTILSVIQAFADELQTQAVLPTPDIRTCFKRALTKAQEALASRVGHNAWRDAAGAGNDRLRRARLDVGRWGADSLCAVVRACRSPRGMDRGSGGDGGVHPVHASQQRAATARRHRTPFRTRSHSRQAGREMTGSRIGPSGASTERRQEKRSCAPGSGVLRVQVARLLVRLPVASLAFPVRFRTCAILFHAR